MTDKMHRNLTGDGGRHETGCHRAEDTAAYLYGETTEAESKSFTHHLNACAVCRDEVAAFTGVREAIGDWRAEVLRVAPSLTVDETAGPETAPPVQLPRRRSARAALREFFALSPWWMQAGTATAALVICTLAALSLARADVRWDQQGIAFGTGVRVIEKRIEVPMHSGVPQSQVAELTTKHAGEVDELRRQLKQKEESLTLAMEELSSRPTSAAGQMVVASDNRVRTERRRTTRARTNRTPNSYLADNNEDELPRLYDLLRDVN